LIVLSRGFNWIKVTATALIVFVGFFVIGAVLQVGLSQFMLGSVLKNWEYSPPAETTLYTSDNKVLMQFGYIRQHRNEFPPLLKKSVVEMEDKRFYHHWGVDPKGMLRALWVDIRLGYKAQGASTITQQLARTLFLTNKKSLMRKTKEMVIATALEKKYTKDEILNMYLNEIYMGRGVCGMEAAAQTYFNKSVDDLSVGETAYLVAMIASPEYYSPDHDFKALKKRQLTVLKVMQEAGIITEEEEESAAKQPVYLAYKNGREKKLYSGQGRAIHFAPDVGRTLKHPYFTVYVLQKLKNEYGEDAVYRGGLKVYTTMDSRMQQAAENAIEEKPWHRSGASQPGMPLSFRWSRGPEPSEPWSEGWILVRTRSTWRPYPDSLVPLSSRFTTQPPSMRAL